MKVSAAPLPSDAPPPARVFTSSQRILLRIRGRSSTAHADRSARLYQRSTWRTAFWTLVIMIRNVLCSTAIAWAANLWYSRGNLFSSEPPARQTHEGFLTAVVATTFVASCLLNVFLQAARLFPQKFARWPERRPSFLYCVVRIVGGSYAHFLVSFIALIGMVFVCGRLAEHWRQLKLEFYVASALTQYYYAVIDMVARKIFQDETLAGREKKRPAAVGGEPRPCARVLRVFAQNFPSLASIWFAGAFVHLVSEINLTQNGHMMAFVVVTMAMKLTVQELAKHYVMRRHVTHLHNMCIVVGIPTVLVNTQVRIVIMSMQNAQSTMLGTWLMAIIEVWLRLGKVVFLRWQMRRKRAELTRRPGSGPTASRAAGVEPHSVATTPTEADVEDGLVRFREWRAQTLALHTAEIYADMYAEYIAMGCSSSIYYFCAGNAQYKLGIGGSAAALSSAHQLVLLLEQVAIELVVDYVSCIVEIAHGIDFEHFEGFGMFLGSLFMVTALLNVSISAVLYIAPTARGAT